MEQNDSIESLAIRITALEFAVMALARGTHTADILLDALQALRTPTGLPADAPGFDLERIIRANPGAAGA